MVVNSKWEAYYKSLNRGKPNSLQAVRFIWKMKINQKNVLYEHGANLFHLPSHPHISPFFASPSLDRSWEGIGYMERPRTFRLITFSEGHWQEMHHCRSFVGVVLRSSKKTFKHLWVVSFFSIAQKNSYVALLWILKSGNFLSIYIMDENSFLSPSKLRSNGHIMHKISMQLFFRIESG